CTTSKFSNILRFWVGRLERADADSIFFGKENSFNWQIGYFAGANAVSEFYGASGAQVSLYMYTEIFLKFGPQITRYKMQRIFIHGAATNRVHRACFGFRIFFYSSFSTIYQC